MCGMPPAPAGNCQSRLGVMAIQLSAARWGTFLCLTAGNTCLRQQLPLDGLQGQPTTIMHFGRFIRLICGNAMVVHLALTCTRSSLQPDMQIAGAHAALELNDAPLEMT